MAFLEKVYLGNTLQNWLVALCIMVVAFAYPTVRYMFKIILKEKNKTG